MTIARAIAQKSRPNAQQSARPSRSSRLQVPLPSTALVGGLPRGGRQPAGRAAGDRALRLGPPAVTEGSRHRAPYLRIARRATQPVKEQKAAEKRRTAAIAKSVALAGGELSWSTLLTIVGASGRDGS